MTRTLLVSTPVGLACPLFRWGSVLLEALIQASHWSHRPPRPCWVKLRPIAALQLLRLSQHPPSPLSSAITNLNLTESDHVEEAVVRTHPCPISDISCGKRRSRSKNQHGGHRAAAWIVAGRGGAKSASARTFRAAKLSLAEAIAIGEQLHPGSRIASVSFELSASPSYRVLTVKNNETWEDVIDANTGTAAAPETIVAERT